MCNTNENKHYVFNLNGAKTIKPHYVFEQSGYFGKLIFKGTFKECVAYINSNSTSKLFI